MKGISLPLVIRPLLRPMFLGTCIGLMVVASAGRASAQDSSATTTTPPPATRGGGNGIGVGAAAFLSGIGGVLVNYDEAIWDIEGILGFSDRRTGGPNSVHRSAIDFGARGWYHIHRGASSDFSIGGGVGMEHVSNAGTATLLEPGVRARAFITSNVAVHAMVGLSIVVGDNVAANNAGFGLGAQTLFGAGFTYYFK